MSIHTFAFHILACVSRCAQKVIVFISKTLPKALGTQGLSALTKVIAFKSHRKFIKIQVHNVDQTLAQMLNQTSASKS